MSYQPGTHIIASLQATGPELLTQHEGFRKIVEQLISTHELQKLGEVYHDFSPAGFTAVICLSESHISIHTWPEHGLINLDIYLSNFQRNNDGTTAAIYRSIKEYFGATISREQFLTR
ncbi:MAG: adenosylmethionine decarboxylase [Citrobacter freundii]|nr:MAG: adenosylmethionine decarboxylase [Citrobacter freundii]